MYISFCKKIIGKIVLFCAKYKRIRYKVKHFIKQSYYDIGFEFVWFDQFFYVTQSTSKTICFKK